MFVRNKFLLIFLFCEIVLINNLLKIRTTSYQNSDNPNDFYYPLWKKFIIHYKKIYQNEIK